MAAGDRINIADKETLDAVKANAEDINSKLGSTADPDGTEKSGTLMGKINAIRRTITNAMIPVASEIYQQTTALVSRWTAERANNLDAAISSRESEGSAKSRFDTINANTGPNHTASSSGSLSQKLSYIINQLYSMGQKKLVSKQVSFATSTPGTHMILEVVGGGQFEYARSSLPYNADVLVVECDGIAHRFSGKYGTCFIGRFMSYPTEGLTCVSSDTFNNINYLVWQPFHFKDRLRIYVEKGSSSEGSFHGHYSLYE